MTLEILDSSLNTAATFTFGTVTIAWLVRILWRRLIKDNTEVAKDRAEINIIDVLQSQIATLSGENLRLRNTEADIAQRLGRLEAKEKEADDLLKQIEKLQRKLDEKDLKIENLIITHSEENAKLTVLLGIKDKEIEELRDRIKELEDKLKGKIKGL